MPRHPRASHYARHPITGKTLHADEFKMDPDITITVLGEPTLRGKPKGPDWAHANYQVSDLTTTARMEWRSDPHGYVAGGVRYHYMSDAALAALGRG